MKDNKDKKDLSDQLGTQTIPKLVSKYFWPTFFASILSTVNNIVDRMYIGRGVGEEALAGVALVFPIMLAVVALVSLISTGSAVKVSTLLGEKNKDRAELALGNSTVISIIFGLIIFIFIFLFKDSILKLFGVGDAAYEYAHDYLSIIIFGWMLVSIGHNFSSVARSEGNIKIAMYAASIALSLNIIFDPIFIFGFNMGVKGAAWASVISNIFMLIWGIYHFKSKHSFIKLKTRYFKLEKRIVLQMMKIGFAPFVMALSMSFVQGLTNFQLTKYGGDLAVGVFGIIMSIMGLMMLLVRSLASAAQPIISFNNGAKNWSRINETNLYLMKMSTLVCTMAFAVIMVFPEFFVQLFSKGNREFIEMGITGLRLSSLTFPLFGIMMIGSQYFIAVQQTKKATFLNLLNQVIIYIPLLFVMGYFYKLNGIWLSNSISIGLAAIIILLFIVKEYKRLAILDNKNTDN